MGWSFDDEAMKAGSLRWPSPRSLVVGTFLLLAVLLPPVVEGQTADLFTPVDEPSPSGPLDERALRSRAVDIDFGQLQDIQTELADSSSFNALLPGYISPPATGQSANPAPGTTLRLNLFDDTVVTGIIEHIAPAFSGGYAVVGRIVGDRFGTMALVINGETVSGTVRLSDGIYQIQSWDGEQYVIREVEETVECSSPLTPEDGIEFSPLYEESHPSERRTAEFLPSLQELPSEESSEQEEPLSTTARPEPHSVINVAVFYTPKVRAEWGGTKQIKTRIDLMIAESNQAYKNSGVQLNLKLAAAQEVGYTEAASADTDLPRLRRPGDGYMDEVHTIRDRVHADISVLLRTSRHKAGAAYPLIAHQEKWLEQNAAFAFAVSSVDTITFIHEIGHLMGLGHDRYKSGCEDSTCDVAAYPYAYGYVNLRALVPGASASTRWGTIMSYTSLCFTAGFGCPEIPRFSNPRQVYPDPGGDPLGVASTSTATGRAGPADAARALNNTRTLVANFRNGPSVGYLENPGPNSPQSGIGLVSGWACDAEEVIIEFEFADGRSFRSPAAVGTLRSDTVGVCGHDKTGFSLLWNWNILGDGAHTVKAFAEGHLLGAHDISVTTLGLGDFPRGLSGEYVVQDFPAAGKSTPLEWSQTRQNFSIASQRADVANPGAIRDTRVGIMGNPAPGSAHSGVGVVSGWHCRAESVRIELTNGTTGAVITTQAGSGTERSDTEGVCGDSDNGFGLLWNWNILGDGWHTVRAFADEEAEPFSWSTVFVTTFGEEFARGLSGEFELADFPSAGKSVTIEWRQEQQNFVITGVE